MQMTVVVDTNVLLHNPRALFSFSDADVVIPIEVIEAIDEFKRNMDERGGNSRTVARLLDDLRKHGRLGDGVALENGSRLRVACEAVTPDLGSLSDTATNRVDNRILALAVHLSRRNPERRTVIITKNVNLRLKADTLGIEAHDYDIDRSPDGDSYTGCLRTAAPPELIETLNEGKPVRIPELQASPNQYVSLVENGGDDVKPQALGCFQVGSGLVRPLRSLNQSAAGIRSLNLEQTFALDALFSDDTPLVTLGGKAGTGKTLLAVAAGLHKIFVEDRYNRLLVFRPTMAVGRDIGFLPGDVAEKMRPWMQPIYDALELIREEDRRSTRRVLPPDLLGCEEISIEPLAYIRGRSIPHQYIIIDEAQNLTPLEVKTVVTRVGRGTKIIMTGDPQQIDNPYVDSLSNGLSYLVSHFRESPLAAHVSLWKGERSELAETAADLL
jgi:PhoH-like ATPase